MNKRINREDLFSQTKVGNKWLYCFTKERWATLPDCNCDERNEERESITKIKREHIEYKKALEEIFNARLVYDPPCKAEKSVKWVQERCKKALQGGE